MTSLSVLLPSTRALSVDAITRRLDVWLSARRLAFTVMAVLAIGVSTSIITTRDTLWWQFHFSALGTFPDFSGHVFNLTLIGAGVLILAFAVRVRNDLRSLEALRGVKRSRPLILLIGSTGINLAGVGMIPLNVNNFWHDRAASGIMGSFLGILIVTVLRHRHVPARLMWATAMVAVGLVAAIAAFVTASINLAALELIGFSMIFAWIGVFTACLHKGIVRLKASGAAELDEASEDIIAMCEATPLHQPVVMPVATTVHTVRAHATRRPRRAASTSRPVPTTRRRRLSLRGPDHSSRGPRSLADERRRRPFPAALHRNAMRRRPQPRELARRR